MRTLHFIILIFITGSAMAHQDSSNSILAEVVVIGQHKPQSVKNSVYQVRVITNDAIRLSGATNIQQALMSQLGFMFYNDNSLVDTADSATASAAFNKDSIKVAANAVVSGCWTIGEHWRDVKPPLPKGVLKNHFYTINDTDGKYFKFKCKAVGQGSDGGTRGKPEFKYELIRLFLHQFHICERLPSSAAFPFCVNFISYFAT